MEAIPVSLITGFLGAGKTSLINHLLRYNHGQRLAVLVNDFGDLNIDSALIAHSSHDTVQLADGCICCSIREDLVDAVQQVVKSEHPPQRILVELSGLSDPAKVVRTVRVLEATLPVFLDGVIAVVDAERFPARQTREHVLARDQLAASDIVVLNKVDLVDAATLQARRHQLRAYKPAVRLLQAVSGQVPVVLLLGSGHAPGEDQPPRQQSLKTEPGHGYSSFCYESKQPVSLSWVRKTMLELPAFVVRAKGVLYLRERPARQAVLQVVGRRARLTAGPRWSTEGPFTRLAFIGISEGFDRKQLSQLMQTCHLAPQTRWEVWDWLRRFARSAGA